jgi:hypothetical protein
LIRNAKLGIYPAVKGAHNGQPKVNASKRLARKTLFFRPIFKAAFKISRMDDHLPADLMKMNAL